MIRPDLTLPIPDRITAAHFIGIGGSGMSGLARMFLDRGIRVTGSDRSDSTALRDLERAGAVVHVGHDASHLGGEVDAVVHTGAIWPDNPEYREGLRRGIPVIHRSQALKWLIGSRPLLAVAGAHGKTTTTGMIVTALQALGTDPSFVSGGVIAARGVSSGTGSDAMVVIEADESDGTFLIYDTSIALITNVDPDHLDHWGSADAFFDGFVQFAGGARDAVVISADDPGALRVRERIDQPRLITFGRAADADVRVTDIDTSGPVAFTLEHSGRRRAVRLGIPGAHNAVNAAGAVAALIALGRSFEGAADAVAGFAGTVRRFEFHGMERGVSVYDDYAHHPTEVAAALSAARTVVGAGRLIAIHQPHTYSRTRVMSDRFAQVLEEYADQTIVLDVYGAREDPVPGVTGALVRDAFQDRARVRFIPEWSAAAAHAAAIARPGDFIITLGCGDVYRIIPDLLAALAATGPPAGDG
jgi:UDP-N-acetylmuramate--alanine ligase